MKGGALICFAEFLNLHIEDVSIGDAHVLIVAR